MNEIKYECARHGLLYEEGHTASEGHNSIMELWNLGHLLGRYCFFCFAEKLDNIGVGRATEVIEESGDAR